MYKGAEDFVRIFEKYKNERPILVYGDPDVDGLFTLYLICQFCEMMGVKYKYYVNQRRQHGFMLDTEKIKGYMVISGDFSVTSEDMKHLVVDNDLVILSTDHHLTEDEFIHVKTDTAEGIHINNQYPFEPQEDRYLSGAGVFYELICSLYPEFNNPTFVALVGITLLSDARAIENPKAKMYLTHTFYSDTSKGYLNYLITNIIGSKDFNYGVPKIDRNFIDFNLSPQINAMLRFGKLKEAIDFVLGKGLDIKDKSKEDQKDLMFKMAEKKQHYDLTNLSIICINEDDFPDVDTSGFIGLYCGKYKDTVGGISTLGFCYHYDETGQCVITRASFRGRFSDINYNKICQDNGIDARGHEGAFGIKNFNPVQGLYEKLNQDIIEAERGHKPTNTIKEVPNLMHYCSSGMSQRDSDYNCFVRDMFRTYFKYTGSDIEEVKRTYKMTPLTEEDMKTGVEVVTTKKGVPYKYDLDSNGEMKLNYIEYRVDGLQVKSFGVPIEEGIVLPIKERGHVQFYVREPILE